MRKYDFTNNKVLSVEEIKDRIEHPVLKDGTVTVFKIVCGGMASFRCAACLDDELFDGCEDTEGPFRRNVERGLLKVIAVPQTDFDPGCHTCSGCDRDLVDFEPDEYEENGDVDTVLPDTMYADGARHTSRLGEQMDGDYNGEIMLQCPKCGGVDELETLVIGWVNVAADGQFGTDDMENAEVLDADAGGKTRCGNCNFMDTTSAFTGDIKLFKIHERRESFDDGESFYEETPNYARVPDGNDANVPNILSAIREQFKKYVSRPFHVAKRLTDRNIAVIDTRDGKILFDLRHNYEAGSANPENTNGIVQCRSCGFITRDSKFTAGADGVPVCPNCSTRDSAGDYCYQEGILDNPGGAYTIFPVAYASNGTLLAQKRLDAIGTLRLPENTSVMHAANVLNAALKKAAMNAVTRVRIVKRTDKAFAICADDGTATMYIIEKS